MENNNLNRESVNNSSAIANQVTVMSLTYNEVKNFGNNQRNRRIKPKHVKQFFNDIKTRYVEGVPVFGATTIIVNPIYNHVIDGQHRLAAYCKAVEEGIIPDTAMVLIAFEPIDDKDRESQRIIDLNGKAENWNLEDYVMSYAADEKYGEPYKALIKFCEESELCHKVLKSSKTNVTTSNNSNIKLFYRYAAACLKGKNCSKILKDGTFEITDEEWVKGCIVQDEILSIRNKIGLTSDTGIESMVIEWYSAKEETDLTVDDILNMHVPDRVKKMEKKNADNWHDIFSEYSRRKTAEMKKKVA